MSSTIATWMPLLPVSLCALLVALLSDSMQQCLLLMILSTLNVVGVFLAWKFGWRVIELVLVMFSGIVISRAANGSFPRIPVLFVVVLMTMVGLWTLERLDEEREREKRSSSVPASSSASSVPTGSPSSPLSQTSSPPRAQSTVLSPSASSQSLSSGLLPPEILQLLFGSSSLRTSTSPHPSSTKSSPIGVVSPFIHPDRTWLSLLLHAFIKHAAPVKVPQFDIGGKLPLFSTRYFQRLNVKEVRDGTHLKVNPTVVTGGAMDANGQSSSPSSQSSSMPSSGLKNSGIIDSLWKTFTFSKSAEGEASSTMSQAFSDYDVQQTSHIGPTGGFHAIVDFAYSADENTKIEVEIPMQLPLWGALSVPVMVTSPEIAGGLVLEFRHDVVENEDDDDDDDGGVGKTSHSKVMAVSFMFEPIREIHIHGIHISLASQFQLIQYIPIVKRYMKQAVNQALLPDVRRVMIFDSSFTTLASFQLAKDDLWNIPGLLQRAKQEAIEQGMDPQTVAKMKHPHVDDSTSSSSDNAASSSSASSSSNTGGKPMSTTNRKLESGFSFPVLDLSDPDVIKDDLAEITLGVSPKPSTSSHEAHDTSAKTNHHSSTMLEKLIQRTEVNAEDPSSLQPRNAYEAYVEPPGSQHVAQPPKYPKLSL